MPKVLVCCDERYPDWNVRLTQPDWLDGDLPKFFDEIQLTEAELEQFQLASKMYNLAQNMIAKKVRRTNQKPR